MFTYWAVYRLATFFLHYWPTSSITFFFFFRRMLLLRVGLHSFPFNKTVSLTLSPFFGFFLCKLLLADYSLANTNVLLALSWLVSLQVPKYQKFGEWKILTFGIMLRLAEIFQDASFSSQKDNFLGLQRSEITRIQLQLPIYLIWHGFIKKIKAFKYHTNPKIV